MTYSSGGGVLYLQQYLHHRKSITTSVMSTMSPITPHTPAIIPIVCGERSGSSGAVVGIWHTPSSGFVREEMDEEQSRLTSRATPAVTLGPVLTQLSMIDRKSSLSLSAIPSSLAL